MLLDSLIKNDDFDINNLFEAHYDPSKDKLSIRQKSDTRKTPMTFFKLAKLKRMRDINRIENEEYDEFVQTMYGPSQEDENESGFEL